MRNRFLAMGVLCLVPLMVVAALLLREIETRSHDEIVAGENTLSSLVSSSTTNYLNSHFRTLDSIAVQPDIVQHDDVFLVEQTLGQARAFRPELTGLFLVLPDGALIGQAGVDAESVLPRVQESFDRTMSTGQRTISDRVDLNVNGQTSVIVLFTPVMSMPASSGSPATPVATPGAKGNRTPGNIVGVVGMIVPVDHMQQAVIPSLRTRTDVAIISEDQVIVGSGDLRNQEARFLDLLRNESEQSTGAGSDVFSMKGLAGGERVATTAAVPSEGAAWYVVVTNPAPTNLMDSWVVPILTLLAIAGGVNLLIALAFGEFATRGISELANHAGRLANGDFSTRITPFGAGETFALGTFLSAIRERLEKQNSTLVQRQTERQHQTEQMRELLRRDLRVQEDERRHIASDIHDAVSPLITGALYQNRALQMSNGSTPHDSLMGSLSDINGLLERASDELHGIIFDLRPPDLDDIGIVAAIEAYVSTIQRSGLEARLEVVGDVPGYTAEVRLGIYRIVQEALHNVLRHSGADEAVVKLEHTDDMLRVTIRDNGTGFDPVKARRPTSLGLLSMRERAAAINGSFEIISKPGTGTAIIIERRDTGSVMSDDLLDDLIRHRTEEARQLDEASNPSDNKDSAKDSSDPPA